MCQVVMMKKKQYRCADCGTVFSEGGIVAKIMSKLVPIIISVDPPIGVGNEGHKRRCPKCESTNIVMESDKGY